MTKSAKHKKEFRREKNKIKLKLTAKLDKSVRKKKGSLLPKGLNVTDTSFKTKKIIIPENLRPSEDSGIPLSHRKQSFKELLSHMGHFNSTIQQDGINGMRELLIKFPGVLDFNMSSLLGKLSELMSARDTPVRKCSLKLLDHIIQSSTPEKIMPFFPLLNAQLMCCMNHINLDIQKDSHLLLDILLTHVPQLVAGYTLQILPNFLEQISCRDDSKAGKRILTINPNQRLTSLKWRQEVLTRVNRLLRLMLEKKESESKTSTVNINFQVGKPCPLYIERNFDVKLNFQKPGHISAHEKTSSSNHLQEFCSHLFPLVIETWVEALANEQLNKNQGCSLIGPESIVLFSSITNIMFTLWSIINQSDDRQELLNWFQQQCGEALIRNFFQRFPFSPRIETKPNKKQSQNDPNCREHNLILCFLWVQLDMKNAEKFAKPIFQYLTGLFQSTDNNVLTPTELHLFKEILLVCCSQKKMRSNVDGVIKAAVEFSNRLRSDRKDRLMLNRILISIGQVVGEREDLPSLKTWIESSPAIIRDRANIELLESINRVMSRNSICLANGRKEVAYLIANIESSGQKIEHWKAVFDFFYLTSSGVHYQESIVASLTKQIEKIEDPAVKSYGMGVLNIIGAQI